MSTFLYTLNATQAWSIDWTNPLNSWSLIGHLFQLGGEMTQGVCTTRCLAGQFIGATARNHLYPLYKAVITDDELWSTSGLRSTQVLAWPLLPNPSQANKVKVAAIPCVLLFDLALHRHITERYQKLPAGKSGKLFKGLSTLSCNVHSLGRYVYWWEIPDLDYCYQCIVDEAPFHILTL